MWRPMMAVKGRRSVSVNRTGSFVRLSSSISSYIFSFNFFISQPLFFLTRLFLSLRMFSHSSAFTAQRSISSNSLSPLPPLHYRRRIVLTLLVIFSTEKPLVAESCLRQPFVLAARWRLAVVSFPPMPKEKTIRRCRLYPRQSCRHQNFPFAPPLLWPFCWGWWPRKSPSTQSSIPTIVDTSTPVAAIRQRGRTKYPNGTSEMSPNLVNISWLRGFRNDLLALTPLLRNEPRYKLKPLWRLMYPPQSPRVQPFHPAACSKSCYERNYCGLAILGPRRCNANPPNGRDKTDRVAFLAIFRSGCPLSSRRVVESFLSICFLSCWLAGVRIPRPSWKPASNIFLTWAYRLGYLLCDRSLRRDTQSTLSPSSLNTTLLSLSFSALLSSYVETPHHVSHHYDVQPSQFLAKRLWCLLHPRDG